MSDKFAMQSWPLRRYEFPMPIRYHLTAPKGPGIVFCMHGYEPLVRRLALEELSK